MKRIRPLPTPREAAKLISNQSVNTIYSQREKVAKLIQGSGDKALIIGPCSIHSYESTITLAKELLKLDLPQMLCMRVMCEKPRTISGWKGFIYDPDLDGSNDMAKGLIETRRLFRDLTLLGMPIATEFLDPLIAPYLCDFVTWGFIGARTAESQIHRQLVSSYPIPFGIKNRTDGDIDIALNAIKSAQHSHSHLELSEEGKPIQVDTPGNPHTHLVLRGSTKAQNHLKRGNWNTKILIDCSHGNAQGNVLTQLDVYHEIQQENHPDVIGTMLECSIDPSLTDPNLPLKTFIQSVSTPQRAVASIP
ncbi:MAG: Phospho-2-dehydro-3-deoxyheptonate aldolase, Trp-sensitive [Chlamydiia bacterium]|nr:Phospho-2-dehydro-3-deoxyheptonate aldolase, Trp-sensitive [Chlamydiia bacterium]MCH9615386.1 Phospho-2-dehydro-3-deoxyheptonate aldolase, Trp-sensitive [Chlamydiia bacterium]MCH9628292.1 Phospho-2-dehydro-3-deoxyheptonate aldolase, Trp-sensitive [Chlamydiia bacterium]